MARFICADSYASTGQGLLGANMFAYCGNNPINAIDPSGELALVDDAFAIIGLLCVTAFALIYTSSDAGKIGWKGICEGVSGALSDLKNTVVETFDNRATVLVPPVNQSVNNSPSKSNDKAEEKVLVKTQKQYYYWEAYRINVKGGSKVIVGRGLTLSEATARVSMGFDIMCANNASAKVLIYLNRYRNAVGPEIHGKDFYWHYHPNRSSHVHIWYYGI